MRSVTILGLLATLVLQTSAFVCTTSRRPCTSCDASRLLDDFKANGEVIDPYQILKVSRKAERTDIRQSYRDLSRRYHPDGRLQRRNSDILPGACNTEAEVEDHWEKIRFSYEILSNPKLRKRYDQREAFSDPGRAIQRAAVSAAWSGMASVGKSIWGVGEFAVTQLSKEKESKEPSRNAVE
jgi:DnaJ-class molecular chaperone